MTHMGLLETLGLRKADQTPSQKAQVLAQLNPPIMDSPFGSYYGNPSWGGYGNYATSMTRQSAMAVPSVARCRSLIANTIASVPLKTFDKKTGQQVANLPWVDQLDKRQPRSVTIAWLVDSLLFFGCAYLMVKETYIDDNRPASFEFIQNDRISIKYAADGHSIDYYMVDGSRVPDSGIGSLITIQGLTQGILLTSMNTIQAALDIEKAAAVAAQTPMGTGYIKNNGSDIPDNEVQAILNAWKSARQNRGTAFLTQTLDFNPISFSPKDMMYNEAKQYFATEIARICNVPAYMIDAEVMKSMTYQNVVDARQDFLAYSLSPFTTAISSRFSMDDMTSRGVEVRFDVDNTFLAVDPMARLNVTEKMLQLGLIDVNQAKQMEGLAPDGSGNSNSALNI